MGHHVMTSFYSFFRIVPLAVPYKLCIQVDKSKNLVYSIILDFFQSLICNLSLVRLRLTSDQLVIGVLSQRYHVVAAGISFEKGLEPLEHLFKCKLLQVLVFDGKFNG